MYTAAALRDTTPQLKAANRVNPINNKNNFDKLSQGLLTNIFAFFNLDNIISYPLINRLWKQLFKDNKKELSAHTKIWYRIFDKSSLARTQTIHSIPIHSSINKCSSLKYHDIAMHLFNSNRFGPALAASHVSAKFNAINGAFSFKNLCEKACDNNDYALAMHCQKLSKHYSSYIGNRVMCYLIIHQTSNANFLEKYKELIHLALALIFDDLKSGLEALLEIIKKLAVVHKIDEAMKYTQLGNILKGKMSYKDDVPIDLYDEMCTHFLHLKHYDVAESCAKKVTGLISSSENCYVKIIVAQILENGFINQQLLAKFVPKSPIWIVVHEEIAIALIEKGKYKKALEMAKICMQFQSDLEKNEFKTILDEKFKLFGIDITVLAD